MWILSWLLIVIAWSSSVMAGESLLTQDLHCHLVSRPQASEMKIQYAENLPQAIFLRTPEQDEFRRQNVVINVISEIGEDQQESFIAQPVLEEDIDWSQEPRCYKQIGTQWYFHFHHGTKEYFVQFIPHVVTKNRRCIPPRFRPQTHSLNCSLEPQSI